MPEVKAQFRVGNEHVAGDLGKIHQDFKSFSRQTVREIERTQKQLEQQLSGNVPFAAGFKRYGMRTGMGTPALPGMPAWMTKPSFLKPDPKIMQDRANFIKDMTFLMMPLMNPGSVWATLFSTRQTFSAFTKTKMGQRMAGGTLGGAAAMTAGLVGGATALGAAFMALKVTVSQVMQSFERARNLYSKSLMAGGLNMGFVTRRSLAADALGVSDKDVLQFGYALNFLNPKLEWAAGILAKTTPNLTSVGWEFKILKDNLAAMFATIANDAAPAMRKFLEAMSNFIKYADDFYQKHSQGVEISTRIALGLATFGASEITKLAFDRFTKRFGGTDPGAAPEPLAYMKQMKASNWERMGLVIGGMGSSNPARETAKHTKETVTLLKQIYRGLVPRTGGNTFTAAQSHL